MLKQFSSLASRSGMNPNHNHQSKGKTMKPFKRIISAALGAFGLAAVAMTFATPAQATETAITKNGVTCYLQTGGLPPDNLYPGNSHFYYCGLQVNHHGPAFTTVQSLVQTYPSSFGTKIPNQPIDYYVFSNCLAYYKYSSATPPTTAQLQSYYNLSGVQGSSGFSLPHATGGASGDITVIYEYSCKGTYPTTVANPFVEGTTAHESGHQYDFLNGNPSTTTFYDHLAAWDQQHNMKPNLPAMANDPNYTTDIALYKYWLQKDGGGTGTGWAELFAEQFDVYTQGQGIASQPPEPTQILASYWPCTKLYVWGWLVLNHVPNHTWFVTNGGTAGAACPAS